MCCEGSHRSSPFSREDRIDKIPGQDTGSVEVVDYTPLSASQAAEIEQVPDAHEPNAEVYRRDVIVSNHRPVLCARTGLYQTAILPSPGSR